MAACLAASALAALFFSIRVCGVLRSAAFRASSFCSMVINSPEFWRSINAPAFATLADAPRMAAPIEPLPSDRRAPRRFSPAGA
eukprot:CAMPEP_0182528600 /NCGR_PEP_ID=MMETSP1323-20130603/4613_1 /TAXON_ID=236787 /ORGANISM="Florenciella parvula, Strain RCC1693" /LENGTH=83 /DNA_ID=CAMNT_0024737731 /DNA_START=299 /DNA_END=550 /DNA_ORIENTATION=-